MKKICLIVFILIFAVILPAQALKFVFPRPQGYLSDYANLIDRPTRLRIENIGRTLERRTGAELAVVVVKSTLPYDHLEYANRLFAHWQIGKEGQDNGILLLLALKEKKIRIETGYGIEEIIPDGKAGEILDKFVIPKFREDQYAEGVFNGALAIAQTIGQHSGVKITGEYYPVQEYQDDSADLLATIFTIFFLFFIFSGRVGIFPFLLFGGFGSHSSRGYGSFGGGFGGFGGGISGGGGASRSW
ncbi:TPM domain-containing protein [Candidatus Margulisiibacteriota bacterium]